MPWRSVGRFEFVCVCVLVGFLAFFFYLIVDLQYSTFRVEWPFIHE